MKPDKTDDLSGIHLWLVLWKASRAVEAQAQRSIARFRMVQSDFGVLEALLHRGPLSAKELGAKVLLTSGSITAAVDRLAARGLVRREDDAHDRRACIVQLTADGRRLIERAFARHREEMEEALEDFSLDERRKLLPLLRRLGRVAAVVPKIAETDVGRRNGVSAGMLKGAQPGSKPGARRSSK